MSDLLNSNTRYSFIRDQLANLKAAPDAGETVRVYLQDRVEGLTSLRFGPRDRAALRLFLSELIDRFRNGEIDEGIAFASMNKLVMAAAANSPDTLHLIHAGTY